MYVLAFEKERIKKIDGMRIFCGDIYSVLIGWLVVICFYYKKNIY